jgi:hypothetical protein
MVKRSFTTHSPHQAAPHSQNRDVSWEINRMENGNEPATRRDIEALRTDLTMPRSEMQQGYRTLVDRIGESETRLLTAFCDFARSNLKRNDGA